MKKLIFTLTLVSFIFCFTGCNEDSLTLSAEDNLATLIKAGTGFENPNTFDNIGNYFNLAPQSPVYLTDTQTPMEIWMGVGNEKAGTLVGRISFVQDADGDKVRIDLTDADNDGTPDMFPFVVNLAHIHFADNAKDIPQTKKGNPIPGKFEYNVPMESYTVTTEVLIPNGFKEFGAIHLDVVKYGGVEGFNFYLPNNKVTMQVSRTNTTESYVDLQITGGGFISEYNGGLYEGWCFAKDIPIDNRKYDAYLYSSYEDIPENILIIANINKDNLDNANYLMNKYNVGDEVFASDGTSLGILEMFDIQNALWNLVNDKNYTNVRSVFLVNDALENGDGYIPGCNDKIIFIAVPTDEDMNPEAQLIIGQPIIAEIPVPCEDEGGTAWGDGYWGATFPGRQWGTWFKTTY